MPSYHYSITTQNGGKVPTSLTPISKNLIQEEFYSCQVYLSNCQDHENIYISNFGHAKREGGSNLDKFRSDRFVFHYVVGGKGWFNNVRLSEGMFFFSHPYEYYSILSDKESPLEYYYIGIAGHKVTDFLKGLIPEIVTATSVQEFHFSDMLKEIFDDIIHHPTGAYDAGMYFFSTFLKLMGLHKSEIENKEQAESISPSSIYYKKALAFIQCNFSENISASDVAKHLNISPSYLRQIFSKHCTYSVREMIIRKRLHSVINLSIFDRLSLGEAATQTGFKDYAQFSKLFKNYIGISPMVYKQNFLNFVDQPSLLDKSIE